MTSKNADIPALFEKLTAARQELVDAMRSDAAPISAEQFTFDEGAHRVSLLDLFGDQKDLIVIHNMGRSCVYCTLWADGLNGLLPHFQSRTAIVLMNGDAVDQQREFADSRDWKHRMIRDTDGAFTEAMGFASTTEEGKRSLMPGFTTFHREDDGSVVRISSDFFGPGDVYMPLFPMFDLLKDGLAGWKAQYAYSKPLSINLS